MPPPLTDLREGPLRHRRLLLAALLLGVLGPVLPGFAAVPTFDPTVVRRSLALGTTTVARLDPSTSLIGVTWPRGDATVSLRWHTAAGWTAWAEQESEPGADVVTDGDRGVRAGTEPIWRPRLADAVAVRVDSADQVHPELVVVGERTSPRWVAGGARAHAATSTTGEERLGHVVSRGEWGADESMRKRPTYQARVDAVVVHHTVDNNDYAADDVPAIMRAIYAYHVRGRGWDDIAYNLLVDRFGRIYEGRAGGFRSRAIKGSHTGGFNERTLGVSMIGNLDVAEPAAPMVEAVARVGAWAADTWGFDPRSDVALTSRGSTRFTAGRTVTVPRVLGHRDLSTTACPGRLAYPLLGAWRERMFHLLAPVITDVVVDGAPVRSPGPVRIHGRLTAPARWSVTVTSPYGGLVVSANEGAGDRPELEWDGRFAGLPALPGDYPWTATADDGVHGQSDPVSGIVTVGIPLSP